MLSFAFTLYNRVSFTFFKGSECVHLHFALYVLNDLGDACSSKVPIAITSQDLDVTAKDGEKSHFHEYSISALHLGSNFHLHLSKTFTDIIGGFIHRAEQQIEPTPKEFPQST